MDIGTPDYVISDLKSEWAAQFIRNYANPVFSNPEVDRETFVQHGQFEGPGGVAIPDFEVRLPALATGQRFEDIAVTAVRESVNVWTYGLVYVYLNLANNLLYVQWLLRGGWLSEPDPSAIVPTFTSVLDPVTGETVLTISIGWDIAREWTWQFEKYTRQEPAPPVTTFYDITSSDYLNPIDLDTRDTAHSPSATYRSERENDLKARRLTYTVSFDIVTNQPSGATSDLVLENLQSQTLWDLREAKFPNWFAFGASDKIQARIDELAQPRHLHTVDFPLWQRDPGKSKIVAELDAGSYFRLSVQDLISGVDIAESVMVMNVEYLLGNGRTPTKRLTLIETGVPVEGNPITLDGNALFLDNNPLFLR